MGWKLGNGAKIDVSSHNSILASTFFKPYVNYHTSYPGLTVVALIDQHTKTRNFDCVNQWFHPVDIPRIFKIPILFEDCDNKMAWLHDKWGQFSVKSAYDAVKLLNITRPTTSSSWVIFSQFLEIYVIQIFPS